MQVHSRLLDLLMRHFIESYIISQNCKNFFHKMEIILQVNDSDSVKKFPSRSCPLRYGTAKIQEDALKLFQTGLREYLSSYRAKISGSQHDGWRITGLSVLASKIVDIPSVSCLYIILCFSFLFSYPLVS